MYRKRVPTIAHGSHRSHPTFLFSARQQTQPRCAAFTLVELLVVIAVIGTLIAVLIPAVMAARRAALRAQCASRLKQMGLALHTYHDVNGRFPPGMVSRGHHQTNAECGAFTKLLPFVEQAALFDRYNFDEPWSHTSNYEVVGTRIELFYCPANPWRNDILLGEIANTWGVPLPPIAAGTDYAFCKGANAALIRDGSKLPEELQGPFDINTKVAIGDILDGTSHTLAIGDAASGIFSVRDINNPLAAAFDPSGSGQLVIEQSWSAASTSNTAYPYYGSILAVTAQRGRGDDPGFEPMNADLVAPTVDGNDNFENRDGRDWVSGFRSQHAGGCNFVRCDGSVRFLSDEIDPELFVSMSTIRGTAASNP